MTADDDRFLGLQCCKAAHRYRNIRDYRVASHVHLLTHHDDSRVVQID